MTMTQPSHSVNSLENHQWWEVTVICPLTLEDSVYWAFDELGCKGTASQNKDDSRIVSAYFQETQFTTDALETFKCDLLATADDPTVSVSWQLIEDEDWAKSWKRHWQPQLVGDRLLINPVWLEAPQSDRTILSLDPGSAFGTGAHATTQLCLEALEKQSLENATIADIGCGSGILSIVALLYGAKVAYAADVDPLASSATQANADANQISSEQLLIKTGSLPEIIDMAQQADSLPVDGIVCNILSEIIVALIVPRLSELAGPNTWVILSGVLTSKAPWVEEHLVANGWEVTGMAYKDEWCSMNIRFMSSSET